MHILKGTTESFAIKNCKIFLTYGRTNNKNKDNMFE